MSPQKNTKTMRHGAFQREGLDSSWFVTDRLGVLGQDTSLTVGFPVYI